ncbi:MAG: methylated-DNA-[protein]-cysteine S-methyltransferase [Mycobacteriales bacterium]|jgi:methylated-DNA-[protein]-cysteine S-methyltransferase
MTRDRCESPTWHTTTGSPLGRLTLVRDADGIRGLYFPHHWYMPDRATFGSQADDGFDETITQLGDYLSSTRREFDLPLRPHGDAFQRRVWAHVQQIPYGETVTYGDLATRIGGDATAQRIGAAVGRNPLCVIIPCHRVVGRGGKLTGYAGGIVRKRHLLEMESEHVAVSAHTPRQLAFDDV